MKRATLIRACASGRDDGGAGEGARAQVGECFVGRFGRVAGDLRGNGDGRRERENASPSARVRFATDRTGALLPEQLVGERGISLMWIPPQTTVPPGATARSAAGTSAPSGANRIAASSGSGGASPEPPDHSAPMLAPRARPTIRDLPQRRGPSYRWTHAIRCEALRPRSPGGTRESCRRP
jgi:hypothetical protein